MNEKSDTPTDYMNQNDAQIIIDLEKLQSEEIEINARLNDALQELEAMKAEYNSMEAGNLAELCENTVLESITGQFGLASVFLSCKDGGNVTTTHNFEKGYVANEADAAKYKTYVENNDGSKPWSQVRGEGHYDKPLPKMRKEAFKTQDTIIDEYTGKPLPKDGRAQIDHIVSAKEIESNPRAHLFQSPEDRAKMATADENLAWTNGSANQSKGDKKMEDWLSKKKVDQTNEERFGIDGERARAKDKAARRYIQRTLNRAAFRKYSLELLKTGGKDAAMVAAYQMLGEVVRELVHGVFLEIRTTLNNWGKEKPVEVYKRFKARMSDLFRNLCSKWKDLIAGSMWKGVQAFLSNIVVFVINLFATTLKKLVMMIRAGFVSLTEAVKILVHPPEDLPKEEVGYQAVKILMAGLIGAMSMGLGAAIEKLLIAIPGLQPLMLFPIPVLNRTVSDVMSVTLSALAGGLLSTIALYYMDKVFFSAKKTRLSLGIAGQSSVVAQCQVISSWHCLKEGVLIVVAEADAIKKRLESVATAFEQSGKAVDAQIALTDRTLATLQQMVGINPLA